MNEPNRFRNHYECKGGEGREAHPLEAWSDESSYTNNDKCPVCNAEITPYESEDLE